MGESRVRAPPASLFLTTPPTISPWREDFGERARRGGWARDGEWSEEVEIFLATVRSRFTRSFF
jgi:hypothetical protein